MRNSFPLKALCPVTLLALVAMTGAAESFGEEGSPRPRLVADELFANIAGLVFSVTRGELPETEGVPPPPSMTQYLPRLCWLLDQERDLIINANGRKLTSMDQEPLMMAIRS